VWGGPWHALVPSPSGDGMRYGGIAKRRERVED
jgi:hypothetical protein